MRMLWDNVLVKDLEKKSKVLIADRQGSIPNKGVVVSVGPGDMYGYPELVTTKDECCHLNKGDVVYFSRDRAMDIELGKERLYIVRARDILGVMTDEEARS